MTESRILAPDDLAAVRADNRRRVTETRPTTLYIAGPMTGLPEFNYPAFRTAAKELEAAGYTVLNPTDVDTTGTTSDERTWEWYMRRTLKMMLDADAIATLDGWRNSRGASIEVDTADRIGIGEAPVNHWLAERADVVRTAAETVNRVRSIRCQCAATDALVSAAYENPDLVNEALTDAGVPNE